MKRSNLIKKLQKEFSNNFFRKSEEFSPEFKDGIWTSGEATTTVKYENEEFIVPIFDYNLDKMAPKMEKILKEAGWDFEWYDLGTVLLYNNI